MLNKLKNINKVQILLLLATLIVGIFLKENLTHSLRLTHRFLGMASLLAGIITLALSLRTKSPRLVMILASVSVLFTLMAGLYGMSLKKSGNYDQAFNLMRLTGIIALLSASGVGYKLTTLKSPKK